VITYLTLVESDELEARQQGKEKGTDKRERKYL
jgi:hypothetical protein